MPFLPIYAWVGLWTGLFVVLRRHDASCLMRYFTRFTDEIFAALISLIFIYEALTALVARVHRAGCRSRRRRCCRCCWLWARSTSPCQSVAVSRAAATCGAGCASSWPTSARPSPWSAMTPGGRLAPRGGFGTEATRAGRRSAPPRAGTGWSTRSRRRRGCGWPPLGPAVLVTVLVFLDQNITARLVDRAAITTSARGRAITWTWPWWAVWSACVRCSACPGWWPPRSVRSTTCAAWRPSRR